MDAPTLRAMAGVATRQPIELAVVPANVAPVVVLALSARAVMSAARIAVFSRFAASVAFFWSAS